MADDEDIAHSELERLLRSDGVGPVRRLHHQRREPDRGRARPVPVKRREDEQAVLRELQQAPFDPARHQTGEELLFARPGVQHGVMRKLRRGQYRVEAHLDLHGMTLPMARQALRIFLQRCLARHIRCVRIVHGKGLRSQHRGPVLKGLVNHDLRKLDAVLAFCSARAVDGGSGAVYVLLRPR